ncbi:MAG: hypothetical protein BWY83_03398 [bacterium ADurb.Bin478]|nr:MAG: hypothetical protein BWY83_03398 [bacterium ADurb.Bin478]
MATAAKAPPMAVARGPTLTPRNGTAVVPTLVCAGKEEKRPARLSRLRTRNEYNPCQRIILLSMTFPYLIMAILPFFCPTLESMR